MSELSKQAGDLLATATRLLADLVEEHGEPAMLSDIISLGQATATLALVQATEAQTQTLAKQWGRSR